MIIGLGHQKGVGKDEVGKYLRSFYGMHRVAFADHIKKVCAAMFRLTADEMEDKEYIHPYWQLTIREMYQKVGVSFRETFGKDVWIKAANLVEMDKYHGHVVVTDVRFQNEFDFIREHGGHLVKICRKTGSVDSHISEHDLDNAKWDSVIENNGTLDELYSIVDAMMINDLGCVPND
jgi:hypothetical protein